MPTVYNFLHTINNSNNNNNNKWTFKKKKKFEPLSHLTQPIVMREKNDYFSFLQISNPMNEINYKK